MAFNRWGSIVDGVDPVNTTETSISEIRSDGVGIYPDIPDSVVTQYRFEDEGTTTTATDSAGSNDATITGATYTTDAAKGSHAISTNGSGDIVASQKTIDLVAEGSATAASVGGWMKAANTTVDFAYPIAWGTDTSNLISVHQQGGTYYARLRVGGADAFATATTSVSTSSYIHLAAVVTQSDIKIIVNGSAEDTTSHSLDITTIGSGTQTVGATSDGNFEFAGRVDDATYGNAEWSESDVQAIINA